MSKRFSRSGYNNIAKNNTTKNNAANNNANYKENNNNRNGNGNSNIIKTGMNQKRRIAIVLFLLIAATVALSGNFAYIQLSWGTDLQRMAYAQQNRGRIISPRRGSILDRNGKELAISASVETVWVNPGDIKSADLPADEIAVKLAGMLDLDRESVYKKITASSSYQILKRKIDRTKGDEIREWIQNENLNGIYVDEDTKRFYPGGNLAAHVIGFTGIDNQGLDGIEAVMEKYLKGVPGRILSEVDNRGQELPFRSERRIDAQDGLNVVLTLDESIQYFTQKVIEKAIVDYKVNGGAVAIVMDPRSGDILSLVSYPDYDLNNPFASPPGVDSSTWSGNTAADVELLQKTLWRNKAVADTYEPGSTFKAITSAAGLEEGVITPESRVTDSPVKIGKWTLDCWRTGRLHGEESFREGVYNSCNPVFVRIAQSLGIERFYQYVRAFGFFEKTGIELPGEEQGVIHTKPAEIDMAVASFGQRFTITPIQLITAYSAIANGGMLMKPRLVKELVDSNGNIVKRYEPEAIRQVISGSTSDTLSDILEGVVSEGTGKNAYVRGYKVAGKTGTSETTVSGVFTASFMAFAPADNPVICALVVLFDPKGESHMGGAIAAPVAGKLVEDVLNYLEVERRYSERDKEIMSMPVIVPDLKGKSIKDAKVLLKDANLQYRIEGNLTKGEETTVLEQTPKAGASLVEKSTVIIYTYKPENEVMAAVPDLLHKTVDEATEALTRVGLNIKTIGSGVVVVQQYKTGEKVPLGSIVEVEFRYNDNIE